MSIKRILAVAAIFMLATVGWVILGTTTTLRSNEYQGRLGGQVEALWGTPLAQLEPALAIEIPGSERVRWILPSKNDVEVTLTSDYRQKGLIWYPTYVCNFQGMYSITNEEEVGEKVRVHFEFPAKDGTYDEFAVSIDGKPLRSPINTTEGINEIVEVAPGKSATFQVGYVTRGIREWRYKVNPNMGRVRNLALAVHTDFDEVDFPDGCLSPMKSDDADGGKVLTWAASDLITKEDIGVTIPEKLNPGPLTSRITFFAPVCLIFFFVLVATINIVGKVSIHPMHYLFVAAGFFAFHLLLAYMAGLVNIHLAFAISAVVSVGLVTGYLFISLGGAFPWKIAAAGQVFFLVLFSYSFFLKGVTGLTVAVGAVITLAVLMRVTAHIDWDEVFVKGKKASATNKAVVVAPVLAPVEGPIPPDLPE